MSGGQKDLIGTEIVHVSEEHTFQEEGGIPGMRYENIRLKEKGIQQGNRICV